MMLMGCVMGTALSSHLLHMSASGVTAATATIGKTAAAGSGVAVTALAGVGRVSGYHRNLRTLAGK